MDSMMENLHHMACKGKEQERGREKSEREQVFFLRGEINFSSVQDFGE